MKRENFGKVQKLLEELGEVSESIDKIKRSTNELGVTLELGTGYGARNRIEKIHASEATLDVLLQHYEFEKERIEKELEEL